VTRGISKRTDVSNEYLRQIKDNTGYTAERLVTIDENMQVLADDVKRKAEAEEAITQGTPTTMTLTEKGVDDGTIIMQSMGDWGDTAPARVQPSENSSAFRWDVMGYVFEFNPFDIPLFNSYSFWVKSFISWILFYYYFRWCLDQIKSARRHVENAPQTRGNTVIAGMGGQATAAVAASIISAAIVSCTLVMYGMWRDQAFEGFNAINVFSDNSPIYVDSGAPAAGMWVLSKFFPLATIVALMWNYITFSFQVEVVVAVTAAYKRFINP